MTAVVGLVGAGGTVWMGADSAGVSGWTLNVQASEKVFVRGPYIIGFTTSFRMGQLLRYGPELPNPPKSSKDVQEFMVTKFVDAVRESFKTGGFAQKENEVESAGNFLVGVRGKLYNIGPAYAVLETRARYDAVGCGCEVALGSLFSKSGAHEVDRVRIALRAAERHSIGVRGPFVVKAVRKHAE